MQINIDETTLPGFSIPAKNEFKKSTLKFADDLKKEAYRIEAFHNPAVGNPQVTSSMVTDAATLIRRGLSQAKQRLWLKLLRIAAAVLAMVVGFTYDATKLQDKTYMLIFVVIVALAIITVTVSTILE
jgi:hypothetical protein